MRSHIRAVQSPAGSVRLREARAFINVFPPGVEVLLLAGVAAGRLHEAARSGPDLAELMNRVELLMHDAGASDRAALFETATKALGSADAGWPRMPVLLLDVPFDSEGESRFLWALADQAPAALIT